MAFQASPGLIRKRHIFYVEGYDPQGADGYYRMFRREWKRFLKMWRVEATLGELEIDSDQKGTTVRVMLPASEEKS